MSSSLGRPNSPSASDSVAKRACITEPAQGSKEMSVLAGTNQKMHPSKWPKKIQKHRNRKKEKPVTSGDQSIQFSIRELLGDEKYDQLVDEGIDHTASGWDLEKGSVVEMKIVDIGSFGDGFAVSPNGNWVVVVPFTVPGDVVEAKIYKHESLHSHADLVSVKSPGEWRDDSLVKCKYFGKCSGCQYQMISYPKQLELKKIVVEKAFKHFSGLDASQLPPVEPTLPSGLQYEYRTKLTPHFELPRRAGKDPTLQGVNRETGFYELTIGFAEKGRKRVLDIEECPIATRVINDKLTSERSRIQSTIQYFSNGSTLLLRDSLVPITNDPRQIDWSADSSSTPAKPTDEEQHICVIDHKQIVHEKVQDTHFEQNAGSFFQNNSSILDSFMTYIVSLLPPSTGDSFLVDAYCGSGLFSICLARHFTRTMGIELSIDSIKWAQHNAVLNKVNNAEFMVGHAETIFHNLDFPAAQTTVIIDPPRKGCDQQFINQLLAYKPRSILYISCNVHTQARDVGLLAKAYQIKRIRGADFFPQSHHCESIVVLERIDSI